MKHALLAVSTTALFYLALMAPAHAQVQRAFPMQVLPERGPAGCMELMPDLDRIAELTRYGQIILTDVPLPSGPAGFDLQRVQLDFASSKVYVDGQLDPGGLDLAGVSLWKGKIIGNEASDVLLGLSPQGCYGWVHDGLEKVHIIPSVDAGWEHAGVRFVTETQMAQSPGEPTDFCAALEVPGSGGTSLMPPTPRNETAEAGGSWDYYDCPIAIETDFQLFQVFGSLAAEQTYVALLIGAMSDRFKDQVGVILTYPYLGFYTTSDDPWTSQDSAGAGCGEVLTEFRDAWAGNIPEDAALGHFLSGALLGCGVAWVDVLCNQSYGFSLSCCINGGVTFPVTQGSNTWDFFVMAHELGHNFGSLHTQDYCPPIDKCADNCTGTLECINYGTNLSYCHGCPGGMNNITTYFHPQVIDVMREKVEASCLETWCQVQAYCAATPNSAWPVGAHMDAAGSTSITQNDLVLLGVNSVPDQFGLFYYGPEAVEVPFGDGYRCVGSGGASIYRLGPPQIADDWGFVARPADLSTYPLGGWPGGVYAGSTWYFQWWYRDPAGLGSGFNLSRGLAVSFCP